MTISSNKSRCIWASNDPLYMKYHDEEWGVPIFDDRLLFEFLILEGMQAGLSWLTVLKKRKHFRQCFDRFNAKKIACYDKKKIAELLLDEGIIRNRLKVHAAVGNAKAFLQVKEDYGRFSDYIWQFTGGSILQPHYKEHKAIPNHTLESDAMSKDLKKRGFKFVGTTICYAFMQAVGMVNDHTTNCFRHSELSLG